MPTVLQALKNRSSKRAYLKKPVSKEVLEKILTAAQMTPSGTNIQPWITYAVSDKNVLKNIGDAIIKKMNSGEKKNQFIQYSPLNFINPYKKRRKETGFGLYNHIGIKKDDSEARIRIWHDNFRWFGASSVFFVFVDKVNIDGAQGSFIDCGAYMQSIMLAAQEFKIDTCPQGSTTEFGKIIVDILNVPDNLAFLYSIVLGYADKEAKINSFQPARVPLKESVVFI
ncbi:MAG: nitroreductase [Sulfurimonas sp.]|nr:nitroreductase [Sulfurimonas sp.]